jgi:hypothetical protein
LRIVSAPKSKPKRKRAAAKKVAPLTRLQLLHDAVFSAPGLVFSVLLFGWSVVFIKLLT